MNRGVLVLVAVLAPVTFFACDDKKGPPSGAVDAEEAAATTSPASTTASTPAPSAAPSATAMKVRDVITAQHVLVAWKGAKGAPKTITRSKAEARTRAEEVVAKAKGGADFTALVTEYSDDPGSKDRRGSVGKFTREKMTKPFSDAAFALAVDAVSGVVESDFGFHVIKRNQ